ncbi:hypothetical protein TNCV_3748791 [Trichonephila clavipes]|nr:hypothetical protein TNCV_3748791 [Trichonephila clavipes]
MATVWSAVPQEHIPSLFESMPRRMAAVISNNGGPGPRAVSVIRHINTELVDIHFIYGLANGNGRAAIHLYRERYPTRRQSNHQTFVRISLECHFGLGALGKIKFFERFRIVRAQELSSGKEKLLDLTDKLGDKITCSDWYTTYMVPHLEEMPALPGRGSRMVKVSDRRWHGELEPSTTKDRRVGERCTLNLSRAQTSFRCVSRSMFGLGILEITSLTVPSAQSFGWLGISDILAANPARTSGRSTYSSFVEPLCVVPARWDSFRIMEHTSAKHLK